MAEIPENNSRALDYSACTEQERTLLNEIVAKLNSPYDRTVDQGLEEFIMTFHSMLLHTAKKLIKRENLSTTMSVTDTVQITYRNILVYRRRKNGEDTISSGKGLLGFIARTLWHVIQEERRKIQKRHRIEDGNLEAGEMENDQLGPEQIDLNRCIKLKESYLLTKDPRKVKMWRLFKEDDASQGEIALAYGISRNTVAGYIKKINDGLKEFLQSKGCADIL